MVLLTKKGTIMFKEFKVTLGTSGGSEPAVVYCLARKKEDVQKFFDTYGTVSYTELEKDIDGELGQIMTNHYEIEDVYIESECRIRVEIIEIKQTNWEHFYEVQISEADREDRS